MKNWKLRNFVLKNNYLFYFKPGDQRPMNDIYLVDASVQIETIEQKKKKPCLQIVEPMKMNDGLHYKRYFIISAKETEEDMRRDLEGWQAALRSKSKFYSTVEEEKSSTTRSERRPTNIPEGPSKMAFELKKKIGGGNRDCRVTLRVLR